MCLLGSAAFCKDTGGDVLSKSLLFLTKLDASTNLSPSTPHDSISTDCKVKEVQSDIARFWYATDSMVSHNEILCLICPKGGRVLGVVWPVLVCFEKSSMSLTQHMTERQQALMVLKVKS